MMAHELQHAVEIAETPAIVDGESLVREYKRIGYVNTLSPLPGVAFDTPGRRSRRRTGDERTDAGLLCPDTRDAQLPKSQFLTTPNSQPPSWKLLGVGNWEWLEVGTWKLGVDSEDVTREILVPHDVGEHAVDVGLVDRDASSRRRSGASNDSSSSRRSMTVCRRRAPMFSVASLTRAAKSAMRSTASGVNVERQILGAEQRRCTA